MIKGQQSDCFWDWLSSGEMKINADDERMNSVFTIVPLVIGELMGNPEKSDRVMAVMIKSIKLDIKESMEA